MTPLNVDIVDAPHAVCLTLSSKFVMEFEGRGIEEVDAI
jgi:hypothetical protein